MESREPEVLVVEDDESIGEAIAFHLGREGMRVRVAQDGLVGLRYLRAEPPDVLVLDLMLPGVDGWHLVREAREAAPALPILVVTARTNEHDRVEVLALGADDVIAKPFSLRELSARVSGALRRAALAEAARPPAPLVEGDLRIDPARLAVTVGDRPVDLTRLEFRLLLVLAEERPAVLERDEIHRRVWGGERAHGDRSVDVLVRRLRRKVDEIGGRYTYVQTRHGVGYRLEAVVRAFPVGAPV